MNFLTNAKSVLENPNSVSQLIPNFTNLLTKPQLM